MCCKRSNFFIIVFFYFFTFLLQSRLKKELLACVPAWYAHFIATLFVHFTAFYFFYFFYFFTFFLLFYFFTFYCNFICAFYSSSISSLSLLYVYRLFGSTLDLHLQPWPVCKLLLKHVCHNWTLKKALLR